MVNLHVTRASVKHKTINEIKIGNVDNKYMFKIIFDHVFSIVV